MLTPAWQDVIEGLYQRVGATTDKVDTAHSLAVNAVPQSREVVAGGGLQIGGQLTGNVGLALYKTVDQVSNLPSTGNAEGDVAYALNGRKSGEGAGSGTGVPVWWSGSHWYAFWSSAVVTS